jgi:cyclophilin family peptidyl-prolyl cis-trans isomerase
MAGVVILIVFLTSSNSPKNGSATSTTTTTQTTTASSSANAKAQTAANKVAVAAGCPASPSTRVNTQKYSAAPPMTIDTSKTYTATVVTTAGTFTIGLDATTAPITVNNFVFLADKNYYHCVIFHRVIPTFMDQSGDPTGTGEGGPGYTIPDELPAKAATAAGQYPLGSVAMANTGQPHTGGSQFFIVSGPEGEGLANSYSLFGHVLSGMNVVDKINAQGSTAGVPPDVTQRIISVTIHVA